MSLIEFKKLQKILLGFVQNFDIGLTKTVWISPLVYFPRVYVIQHLLLSRGVFTNTQNRNKLHLKKAQEGDQWAMS